MTSPTPWTDEAHALVARLTRDGGLRIPDIIDAGNLRRRLADAPAEQSDDARAALQILKEWDAVSGLEPPADRRDFEGHQTPHLVRCPDCRENLVQPGNYCGRCYQARTTGASA